MPIQEFVTRVEFDTKMKTIDQKFNDITEIMLREFDKVYAKFDLFESKVETRFEAVDRRFDTMDLRFNRIDNNVSAIMRHLGIAEDQIVL